MPSCHLKHHYTAPFKSGIFSLFTGYVTLQADSMLSFHCKDVIMLFWALSFGLTALQRGIEERRASLLWSVLMSTTDWKLKLLISEMFLTHKHKLLCFLSSFVLCICFLEEHMRICGAFASDNIYIKSVRTELFVLFLFIFWSFIKFY